MSKRSKKQWPPEDANGVDSVFTVTVLAKNVGDKWMQCSQDDPADKQSFTAKVRITQDTPMEAVCTSVDCRAQDTGKLFGAATSSEFHVKQHTVKWHTPAKETGKVRSSVCTVCWHIFRMLLEVHFSLSQMET